MKQKLQDIRDRIARACDESGRNPSDVTLIAVTKNRRAEEIKPLIDLGVIDFGENRVQEAAEKWADLKTKDIRLHLIGPLQTNKVKQAQTLFDVLHTMDRPALLEEMTKTGWQPPCFVQVNTGEEPQKSGLVSADLDAFLKSLPFRPLGLMCIPPASEPPSLHFAFLRKLAEMHGLSHLSMGMSADFENAIRCGATHIRLGSILFDDSLAA